MYKYKTFETIKNGNSYKVTVCYEGSHRIKVELRKVIRPKWKFFRTELDAFDYGYFYLVDYPTIELGVKATVDRILHNNGLAGPDYEKITEYFSN